MARQLTVSSRSHSTRDTLHTFARHTRALRFSAASFGGLQTIDLLLQWLDQFGGKLRLVIVLNEIRGERLELLGTSGQRQRPEAPGANAVDGLLYG